MIQVSIWIFFKMIFEKIYTPKLHEMDYQEMTNTERGLGGFGSTGV